MARKPGKHPITLYQNADFIERFIWKDSNGNAINNTGYSAAMQFKEKLDSDANFLSLSSGTEITLGGSNGVIDILVDQTVLEAITARSGYYDLVMTSGSGTPYKILYGPVTIDKGVVR